MCKQVHVIVIQQLSLSNVTSVIDYSRIYYNNKLKKLNDNIIKITNIINYFDPKKNARVEKNENEN